MIFLRFQQWIAEHFGPYSAFGELALESVVGHILTVRNEPRAVDAAGAPDHEREPHGQRTR